MDLTQALKTAARAAGSDLVGVADIDPLKRERAAAPPELLDPYANAVAVAVRLDDAIVDGIGAAPTPDYARHYREVNAALDRITAQLADWVRARGGAACAIPASQTVDRREFLGAVSLKAVARLAGIGWQGKSLLIVSPQFGPRIRLATVLTDLPFLPDPPISNRCGSCTRCADACPVGAIRGGAAKERYRSRDEALRFERCLEFTRIFKTEPEIQAQVCGVCVKVCPFGTERRRSGARR